MKRRVFLSTVGATGVLIAGCTEDKEPTDSSENTGTDTEAEAETDPGSAQETQDPDQETRSTEGGDEEPDHDAVIEYSAHTQDSASGEYNLPELRYDGWNWIVLDFEVIEGQLSMEDVWFRGLFETQQRYYTV